jgi:hypothetical protein
LSQSWWCKVVIPALGRLRQESCEFDFSLDYRERETLFQKETNKTERTKKSKKFNQK